MSPATAAKKLRTISRETSLKFFAIAPKEIIANEPPGTPREPKKSHKNKSTKLIALMLNVKGGIIFC